MPKQTTKRNKTITTLLNGTNRALKQVVSVEHTISKPSLIKESVHVQFGVLIGITGDFEGKLVLSGDIQTFGAIGEKIFGIEVNDDMLVSFSGELGNMLAGNISTNIMHEGITVDITSPSIIEGQAKISGFMLAIQMNVSYADMGDFDIYLVLD